MAFGIDIIADGLISAGVGTHTGWEMTNHGIIGLIPRQNEPLIWNNPRAIRSSTLGPYISLTDAWSKFMISERGESKCSWNNSEGYSDEPPAVNLIADAIKQNIPISTLENTAIAIDNTMNEFQQDSLLRGFKYLGFTKVELLWRPIAICLYILNQVGRENFNEFDKIAIADFDSYYPELTILTLKYLSDDTDKKNGLVPLRNLPQENNFLGSTYNTYKLKRDFISFNFNDSNTIEQLQCGPFSSEFFAFLDSDNYKECFIEKNLSYKKLNFDNVWQNDIAKHSLDKISFESMMKKIRNNEEYKSATYKVLNGFPARVQDLSLFSSDENLVDKKAVAEGAADYMQRRLDGKATYLDTLPGLEIFSNLDDGGYKFFRLIDKGEVEGGKRKRMGEKLPGFNLEQDTETFNSVLRDMTTEKTKILQTSIPPHDYDYHVPLLINAEMTPANGHAIVTIEGDSDHKDVFGRKRRIQLNWKSMNNYEIPENYSGPEVYPVRGRIGDDEECRNIVREHVSNSAGMYFSYTYRNRQVKYQVLHGPWGYFDPWRQPLGEPTRAMFGAHLEEDDEIQVLSDGVSKLIYDFETNIKNRHKYLNYMFRYAPESFREELRNLYSSENPDLNWNTVYGVGRVFYKATDFELFVDFFLNKSEQYGYPAYPDGGYTDKYIWAFFRCLCYYEETNLIPLEKAEKVIKCIINFSAIPGSRQRNTPKFILSAILFSLRFRTNGRAFLSAGTQLRLDVEDLIQNTLPQIDYPPAMFSDVRPDKLNDFVYRFLNEEQKDEDIEALKGLITSMS
jgi:hypothetical protein